MKAMNAVARGALLLVLAQALSGCEFIVSYQPPAETGVQCNDGVDNDGDQLMDCNDDSCVETPQCGCGNGQPGFGEECDDGNADPNDGCLPTCKLATCGDGFVRTGVELCDTKGASPTCDADCSPVRCGDGMVNAAAGESCEEGAVNTQSCDADCTAPMCGDGFVNTLTEGCDGGANNSNTIPNTCRTDCRPAHCGDGVTDNGEACDTAGNSPTCDADCTPASCGDGFINAALGETCDDGAANSNTVANACRTSCRVASCGDNVTDSGEACDLGGISNDECDADCTRPSCGDGFLNMGAGERCDNGVLNSNTVADACRTTCRPAGCGDVVVDTGEQCDDGLNIQPDMCNALCQNSSPFPASCAELRADVPSAQDGPAVLAIGNMSMQPYPAYCHDMAATPLTYLPLVHTSEGSNRSMYFVGEPPVTWSASTTLTTLWNRVRFDPATLQIDASDFTFSTSSGHIGDPAEPLDRIPFGVARDCEGLSSPIGSANVDLRGLPFQVTSGWTLSGTNPLGGAMPAFDQHVFFINGGGSCGAASPALAGPRLQLRYEAQPSALVLTAGGSSPLRGNAAGGVLFNDACPVGEVLVGFSGMLGSAHGQIRGLCAAVSLVGEPGDYRIAFAPGATLPNRGTGGDAPWTRVCGFEEIVVGFTGNSGVLVDDLTFECARLQIGPSMAGYPLTLGTVNVLPTIGGGGGAPFAPSRCPAGQIAVQADIRAGADIDALGLSCAVPTLAP